MDKNSIMYSEEYLNNNEISQFELYFSGGLIVFFLYIAFINRNSKTKNSV